MTGMSMGSYSSEDPSSAGGQDQYFVIMHHTSLIEGICEARASACDSTWHTEQVHDEGGRVCVGREA